MGVAKPGRSEHKLETWLPEAGFSRLVGQSWPFPVALSCQGPLTSEWFGLPPSGAHSSKWASCPILQWCGPTARGPLAPASRISPSQPPLWLGLVFTKFLSSLAIPCG